MNNNKTKKKISLTNLLKESGFILPTNENDIKEYQKIFGKTNVILPEDFDKPDFLFNEKVKTDNKSESSGKIVSIDNKSLKSEPVKNDYFKKLVLAAEIANQLYSESTFGHVKFVKVYYICEEVCSMKLSTNYGEYAAGPLDYKLIYSVDAEFRRREWFTVSKRSGNRGYKYEPGVNIEEYKKYYPRYFKNQLGLINFIIELFRKKSTDFCEIVATMFFVWKKAITQNHTVDDNLLITRFYDWGEQKKKFSRIELKKAIDWMKDEEIVPVLE